MVKPVEENKILVWLTCFYLFNWYFQLGSRIGFFDAIRLEFLMGMALSAIAVFFIPSERSTPLQAPVICWLVILLVYVVFSVNFSHSWDIYYTRVLKFSVVGLFLAIYIRTEDSLKMAIWAFLLVMLKLGQEGFFGWLSGGLVWQNQGILRLHGSITMFRHPNSFSGMAVGCLPFIYCLYPITKKPVLRLLLATLLVFSAVIILFTGSRTGYVATIAITFIHFRKQILSAKPSFWFAAIGLMLLSWFFMPEQYIGRFVSIFTMQEAEGNSSSARLEILRDAWEIFLTYPMGVGVSAFPYIRGELFGRFQDTHNLYLELLTNVGVLGFIVFFFLIYRLISVNRGIAESQHATGFQRALAGAMILFIWARLFLGLFGMDAYEIYWWFAVGFTAANYKLLRRRREEVVSDE